MGTHNQSIYWVGMKNGLSSFKSWPLAFSILRKYSKYLSQCVKNEAITTFLLDFAWASLSAEGLLHWTLQMVEEPNCWAIGWLGKAEKGFAFSNLLLAPDSARILDVANKKVCKIWCREWAAHIWFTEPLLKKGRNLRTFCPNVHWGIRNTLHVKRYKNEQEQ